MWRFKVAEPAGTIIPPSWTPICPVIYGTMLDYGHLYRTPDGYVATWHREQQGFGRQSVTRRVLGRVADVIPHATDIEGRKRGVRAGKLTFGEVQGG